MTSSDSRHARDLPGLRSLVAIVVLVALVGSLVTFLVVRDSMTEREIGPPGYVPFVQEWEIWRADEPLQTATLRWHGCGEWAYSERDTDGGVLGTSYGSGAPTSDEGCNIPGYWFLPLARYRDNPTPGYEALGPFEYAFSYDRQCGEVVGVWESSEVLPEDFCADVGDQFRDRVVVAFDPDTQIPVRYSQYIDDVLLSERRTVSLKLLGSDDMVELPTSDRGDHNAVPLSTATATP